MVNLTTVNSALKNFYIQPLREDINLKADPFASRIMKTTNNIVGYNKIVRAALVGANGGAGAGSETGALPTAGENQYVALESGTKNLYGTLEISDKVVKSATGQNAGAFVNILQQEMDTLTKTLKWNLARQLYGDGSGCLMKVKSCSGGNVLEAVGGDDVRFLLPGLKVDIHNASDGAVPAGKAGLRIVDVDRMSNKVRLNMAVSASEGDYLTIQGSAGYELTGLGKIFEKIEDTDQTLYGVNRSEYSWMRPYKNEAFGAINEPGLQKVMELLEDSYNVTVDHINCGSAAYGHYLQLMNQRRHISDVMTLEGGHKALSFNGIPLTRNKFMPDDAIDLYDTSLFTIDQVSDWEWIEGEAKQVLHQVPGKPVYTATVAKYCDLMCALPGGIARLSGVTAAGL
jgi:hypothetical protein